MTQPDLDAVAEAMWRVYAERNPSWGGKDAWQQQQQYRQDDWLAMAAAAVKALQLKEERLGRDDDGAGWLKPGEVQTHWVSPWVRVEQS